MATNAKKPTQSGKVTAKGVKAASTKSRKKIHIRESPKKDSETLCGGSHSPIWGRSGEVELESVGPQQAAKATCGRCLRVARSARRKLI
jgi:hypothetical protein